MRKGLGPALGQPQTRLQGWEPPGKAPTLSGPPHPPCKDSEDCKRELTAIPDPVPSTQSAPSKQG